MKRVIRNASVTVDSVDLSDHVSAVTLSSQADSVDVTPLGATWKETAVGSMDASITLTLFQDRDLGSVDDTLWTLYAARAAFPVVVHEEGSTTGSTNPSWTMTGVLLAYNPLDGQVGQASTSQVQIACADSSGIVRSTT